MRRQSLRSSMTLTIFSSLAYFKTVSMFCRHPYLLVILGNAHIIRSYLKQLIWMTMTLLPVCCTRTVIIFYCIANFFLHTACFYSFFIFYFLNCNLLFSCIWQLLINEYDDDDDDEVLTTDSAAQTDAVYKDDPQLYHDAIHKQLARRFRRTKPTAC